MANFCVHCGNNLEGGSNVCPNCGAKVEESNEAVETVVVDNPNPNQAYQGNQTYQNTNAKPTNGLAIAGFITSLVSMILCCGSISLISLILSIIGVVDAKKKNGSGNGLAIAGIVISVVGILLVIITSFLFGLGAFVDIIEEYE
jgi:RNA polymerase subunit RPABC4/transcription elongation factor Spt4